MALLNKKLKVKDTNGIISDCNIYTTKIESGDNTMSLSVDGVTGFVSLKSIGEADATNGRVKKGSSTYAIAKKYDSISFIEATVIFENLSNKFRVTQGYSSGRYTGSAYGRLINHNTNKDFSLEAVTIEGYGNGEFNVIVRSAISTYTQLTFSLNGKTETFTPTYNGTAYEAKRKATLDEKLHMKIGKEQAIRVELK